MKIIFLDIDGVLNNNDTMSLYTLLPQIDIGFKYMDHLSPWAISLLNEVIKSNSETKVVITSTWRELLTLEQIDKVLRYYGFKGEILDKTLINSDSKLIRGNEIQNWLNSNKHLNITSYVIVDDDNDMGYLLQRLARIDGESGIREKDVRRINKILQGNKLYILYNTIKNIKDCVVGKITNKYKLYKAVGKNG